MYIGVVVRGWAAEHALAMRDTLKRRSTVGDTGKKDKDKRRKQQILKKEKKQKEKQDRQSGSSLSPLLRGRK